MANRHKMCKAKGGGTKKERDSGNSDVMAEAMKKNRGGEVGKVAGKAAGGRLDRKSGGSVGKSPFSSAGGGSASKSPFFK